MGRNWRQLYDNLGKLQRLPSRIVRPIAARITLRIKLQFRTGQDAYGTPWVPLKPSTVRKKGHTRIMIGKLPGSGSGQMRAESMAIPIGGAGIELVSVPHGAYHVEATADRAARPLFPHRKNLPDKWQTIIREEWAKAFKTAMGAKR